MAYAQRMQDAPALSAIRRMHGLAGPDAINLSLAVPDFVQHPAVTAAFFEVGREARFTRYAPNAGLLELRQELAAQFGVDVQNVVVTSGGQQALFAALFALADANRSVGTFEPFYPAYASVSRLLGATVRTAALGVVFDLPHEFPDADVTVVCPLNNPSGTAVRQDRLEALLQDAQRRGSWLVSDEVYSSVHFGPRPAPSLARFAGEDGLVLLGSASKTFSMTGQRVGWVIAPRALATRLEVAMQNISTCAPVPVQAALARVFSQGVRDYPEMVLELGRRAHYLQDALTRIGMPVAPVDGGCFVFARVPAGFTGDSFADALARRGVLVVPGSGFVHLSVSPFSEFVRVSTGAPMAVLQRAVSIMAQVAAV